MPLKSRAGAAGAVRVQLISSRGNERPPKPEPEGFERSPVVRHGPFARGGAEEPHMTRAIAKDALLETSDGPR